MSEPIPYYIYKLTFYGEESKIYIGCTIDIGARFSQHQASENWLDLCLMPKKIEILRTVYAGIDAWSTELKYINATWEDNYNKVRGGYSQWVEYNKSAREREEFIKYQKEIDAIERQCLGQVVGGDRPTEYTS